MVRAKRPDRLSVPQPASKPLPLANVGLGLRRAMTVVAVIAALVVVALGGLYFFGGSLGGFDGQAVPWGFLHQPWLGLAVVVDFCGEPLGATVLTAITVAVCLRLRRGRLAVVVVAGVGLSVTATTALKPVVGRTIHGVYLSYPSGHTAFATALALSIALVAIDVLRLGTRGSLLAVLCLAIPAGAAMGWTEVVLSAHYPTDTLGGLCTALSIVPAVTWLATRDRQAPPRRP